MGNTANGLTYPEDSAYVHETAAHIKELASDVDRELLAGTAWTDVVLRAGFTYQGGYKFQWKRIGRVCFLRWGVSSTGMTASGSFTIADLPAAARPPLSAYVVVAGSTATNQGAAVIGSGGDIVLKTGPSVSGYYLFDGISYPLD